MTLSVSIDNYQLSFVVEIKYLLLKVYVRLSTCKTYFIHTFYSDKMECQSRYFSACMWKYAKYVKSLLLSHGPAKKYCKVPCPITKKNYFHFSRIWLSHTRTCLLSHLRNRWVSHTHGSVVYLHMNAIHWLPSHPPRWHANNFFVEAVNSELLIHHMDNYLIHWLDATPWLWCTRGAAWRRNSMIKKRKITTQSFFSPRAKS